MLKANSQPIAIKQITLRYERQERRGDREEKKTQRKEKEKKSRSTVTYCWAAVLSHKCSLHAKYGVRSPVVWRVWLMLCEQWVRLAEDGVCGRGGLYRFRLRIDAITFGTR